MKLSKAQKLFDKTKKRFFKNKGLDDVKLKVIPCPLKDGKRDEVVWGAYYDAVNNVVGIPSWTLKRYSCKLMVSKYIHELTHAMIKTYPEPESDWHRPEFAKHCLNFYKQAFGKKYMYAIRRDHWKANDDAPFRKSEEVIKEYQEKGLI